MSCGVPPIAQKIPHSVWFGKVDGENRGKNPIDPPLKIEDPWFWLRDDDRKDPDILAHIKLENDYYDCITHELAPLSKKIYEEHLSHIKETDTTAKYRHGPYYYYTRTVKGLSYKINCRHALEEKAAEEILLDENELAKGLKSCNVRMLSPSCDHSLLAYSVDTTGDELYEIRFLPSVDERIKETSGSIKWGNDNSTLFYITKDEAKRSYKLWKHVIGSEQTDDICLFTEENELFSIGMGKSMDGRFLILETSSVETCETHLLDLNDDKSTLFVFKPREAGVRYSVEMCGETVFVLTNADNCINNKLVVTSLSKCLDWSTVVVPHSKSRFIENVQAFKDFLVLEGREEGLTRLWTFSHSGEKQLREITFDEEVFVAELIGSHNKVFDAPFFRMKYSSLTKPPVWYDVDAATGEKVAVKENIVGGGYDSSLYVCSRHFATAPDQTKIPISVVHKKMLDLSTPHPMMLYGYGSYGICIDPEFQYTAIPYIERDMIYAIAHVRGGGEMGRAWYEVGGKYLTKRNTFQDFISCAEYFVEEKKYTTPQQLACEGRSAGGLLVGAVLNMRPDLFAAAVAGVPFVDVMVSMCDASIPLTTGEWEEWGNPNEAKYFDYMLSYSPLNNVKEQRYPNILIFAGLHDPRVAYWEPLKWASKLRSMKTDNNLVLLKMDCNTGHFSASDRYNYWRERAEQQAFVIKHVIGKLE